MKLAIMIGLMMYSCMVQAEWSTYYNAHSSVYTASQTAQTSKGDWLKLVVTSDGEMLVQLENGIKIHDFKLITLHKSGNRINDLMHNHTVMVRLGDRFAILSLDNSSSAITQVTNFQP